MYSRGIRGAITIDNNTEDSIRVATLELLYNMFIENDINDSEEISHIIFTLTSDLNAAYPAKFVREDLGLTDVAMMCYHELDVPGALPMCLRVLIVLNTVKDFKKKFVYLKGAEILRPDIVKSDNNERSK